jgi:hypothetical protein
MRRLALLPAVASESVCATRTLPVSLTVRARESSQGGVGGGAWALSWRQPVPARFCPRILLSPAMSTDHACVPLPPRPQAVISTHRVAKPGGPH